jgi:hypothetical protein
MQAPDVLYFPHSQMPASTMTFVVRTRTAPRRSPIRRSGRCGVWGG